MEKKKDSGGKLEAFLTGKGFYIVLFLCVAVIAVSTWILIAGSRTEADVEYLEDPAIAEPVVTEDAFLLPTAAPEEEPASLSEPVLTTDAPVFSKEEAVPEALSSDEAAEAPPAEAAPVWSEEQPVLQSAPLFIWPVAGEIENAYSAAALVYNRTMADWRTHEGVDISAPLGAQVMAVSGGVVAEIVSDDLYGTTVKIDHPNGLQSVYCNLAAEPTVYVGDNVSVGEIIGAVGDTALCETNEVTHLHFELRRDGLSVDPSEFLPQR